MRLSRAEPSAVPADAPFVLVESGARGLTISAINAVAARDGIRVGTSLADVRAAFPAVVSRAAEPQKDRIALLRLARWAGRYGPNRHVDGSFDTHARASTGSGVQDNRAWDGLWIDITGVAHLFGSEEALLDDLVRKLASFGLTARVGLGDTLGAAHALARFGCDDDASWVLAPEGLTEAALRDIPVEALRLAPQRVLLLKRLGLRRIGQLIDIPRANLERRFRSAEAAADVLGRLDQALGLEPEPRRPMATPPVLSKARQFAQSLMTSAAIEAVVDDLCVDLCAELQSNHIAAKAIRLSLYRSDGTMAEIMAAMSAPCWDRTHMAHLIKPKLETVDAGFGIDIVRLDALRVTRHQGEQGSLTTGGDVDALARSAHPAALIDRLSNRFGRDAVTVLVPCASHIPERAEVRRPALLGPAHYNVAHNQPTRHRAARVTTAALTAAPTIAPTTAVTTARIAAVTTTKMTGSNAAPTAAPDPASAPAKPNYVPPWPYTKAPRRPAFLLGRPEPIQVVAEVPDGPPVRFIWRRVERRIARAQGPERIAPEWWRVLHIADDDARAAKRPRPRDYYTIEDQQGAAYWVFRHGLYGADDCDQPPQWFLHGLYA